ncbi:MAG: septum formation initiator family protein [Chloroflexi bacterium]|nr:septum formation initiator family protein [Chloroflexota bacterium]
MKLLPVSFSLFFRRAARRGNLEVRPNPPPARLTPPRSPVSRRQFVAIIALAVIGLLLFSFARVALTGYQFYQQAERLRLEIASLQAENRRLQERLRAVQTDEGAERAAREELGWVRPGEIAVVVVAADTAARPGTLPRAERPQPPLMWQRWRQLFFGL